MKAHGHVAVAHIVLMNVASALTVSETYFNVGQTLVLNAQGLGDLETGGLFSRRVGGWFRSGAGRRW